MFYISKHRQIPSNYLILLASRIITLMHTMIKSIHIEKAAQLIQELMTTEKPLLKRRTSKWVFSAAVNKLAMWPALVPVGGRKDRHRLPENMSGQRIHVMPMVCLHNRLMAA